MIHLPPAHPQRALLYDEVHARPPLALTTPSRISHIALLVAPEQRPAEAAHVAALCRHFSVDVPEPSVSQFNAQLGAVLFTWERHGEFSGFTFAVANNPGGNVDGDAGMPAVSLLPVGWLATLPGATLTAVDALLCVGEPTPAFLTRHFSDGLVVGAEIGEGAGILLTDFRIRSDDGYSRVVLIDRSLTVRQAGRTLQRFFEIEVYRMLALLALPMARRQMGQLRPLEDRLAALANDAAGESPATSVTSTEDDEAQLQLITALAGRIESELAASTFRFGACRAYADLVSTRIGELRERRIAGLQTVGEFMDRRFKPAVATCATVSQRLHDLSERLSRASALLSTRVDIARERQNQALLASMNRRAKAQLRLQETVEGLSVAAIVYYAAGLVSYVAKGVKSRGVPVDVDLVIAIAIPVLAALVMLATRRARRRALASEHARPDARVNLKATPSPATADPS